MSEEDGHDITKCDCDCCRSLSKFGYKCEEDLWKDIVDPVADAISLKVHSVLEEQYMRITNKVVLGEMTVSEADTLKRLTLCAMTDHFSFLTATFARQAKLSLGEYLGTCGGSWEGHEEVEAIEKTTKKAEDKPVSSRRRGVLVH